MMVHVAYEDRIATFGWKIGIGFAGFDNRDVREFSLGDRGPDVSQAFGIQFRGKHVARGTDALGGGDRHLSLAGSDLRNRETWFPVEDRGEFL